MKVRDKWTICYQACTYRNGSATTLLDPMCSPLSILSQLWLLTMPLPLTSRDQPAQPLQSFLVASLGPSKDVRNNKKQWYVHTKHDRPCVCVSVGSRCYPFFDHTQISYYTWNICICIQVFINNIYVLSFLLLLFIVIIIITIIIIYLFIYVLYYYYYYYYNIYIYPFYPQ